MQMLAFCNRLMVCLVILSSSVAKYILLLLKRLASSINSCQLSRKVIFAEISAVLVGSADK